MRRAGRPWIAIALLAAGACAPSGDEAIRHRGSARIEVVVRRGSFFDFRSDSLPGDTVLGTFDVGDRFGAISDCCEDRAPFRLVGLVPGRGVLVHYEEAVQFRRIGPGGWGYGPAGPDTVLVSGGRARFKTLVPDDSCEYAVRVVPSRWFKAPRAGDARAWRERAAGSRPRLGESGRVDVPPRIVRRPIAGYPPRAGMQAVDGTVWCAALVDERGRVEEARLLRGHPLLADSALASVRRWEFSPAQRGGRPVATWVTISSRFEPPARGPGTTGDPWPVIEVAR